MVSNNACGAEMKTKNECKIKIRSAMPRKMSLGLHSSHGLTLC